MANKAPRVFFKTTVVVEVLSEEPVEFDTLGELGAMISTGDCSGKYAVTKQERLNGRKAAKALISQGSDPGFFRLTESGKDEEEEKEEV